MEKLVVSGAIMEKGESRDLESFAQTHLITKDTIHSYKELNRGKVQRDGNQRTILMHPSKEGQPVELEH